jgi:hypothetical protein
MNLTQPDALEQRLRRDLDAVAATVTDEPLTAVVPGARRSRRRRWAILAGALAVPVALAAGAIVREGPEYVDTIDPGRVVASGSVDGSRYLLVETNRTDECGNPVTGVELVEERENLLGSEWNTSGHEYGEPRDSSCGYVNDTSRYVRDPSLFNASGAEVGNSFVWVYAVHPRVSAVRITVEGEVTDLPVHEVDGAGYAAYEIPREVEEYRSELLVGGQVVPGSAETRTVPER